jgi:hypothetical protein
VYVSACYTSPCGEVGILITTNRAKSVRIWKEKFLSNLISKS